jgi:hypothetical protein
VFVEGCVLLDEFLLFFGHVVEGVNRVGRTDWDTSAAVDTAFGINIHLRGGFETGLVLLGMNAIGGADLDAKRVLDAGVGDYIGHGESISRMK